MYTLSHASHSLFRNNCIIQNWGKCTKWISVCRLYNLPILDNCTSPLLFVEVLWTHLFAFHSAGPNSNVDCFVNLTVSPTKWDTVKSQNNRPDNLKKTIQRPRDIINLSFNCIYTQFWVTLTDNSVKVQAHSFSFILNMTRTQYHYQIRIICSNLAHFLPNNFKFMSNLINLFYSHI